MMVNDAQFVVIVVFAMGRSKTSMSKTQNEESKFAN
jgi:hypothetical protein